MATDSTQPPSSSSPASTAAYPPWVLLEHYGKDDIMGSHSAAANDARTLVTARTSTCHPISISLRLAAPPALSTICVYFPSSDKDTNSKVLAAHGDSVLIYIYFSKGYRYNNKTANYFVYNAGAIEPPRPPSLSLLPVGFCRSKWSTLYSSALSVVPLTMHHEARG
ncbi:unnamed protein product [Urochloa humidicola]